MGKGEDGQDESSANGEGGSQGEAGSTGSRKLIDLRDCLTDSPRFRVRLSEHEAEITDLETRLEKVVTSCDRMVNNGQAYVEACRSFSSSVRELAGHFHDNTIVEQSLRRFYDTLAEVQSFHSILFDQAQRSVQSALRSFLTGELKKVKDMKKTFHKVSDDLNTAVHRNAHAPKSKPQEAEELSSQLANVQTQFSHTAIDYGYHINTVSCIKGHLLLNHLLSYMRAQFTFFHQGYDLLREFDPYMRHVLSQVDDLQKTSEEDIASMNTRHNLVIPQHLKDGSPEEPLQPMDNPGVSIELEGYLFKRSSGAFKSWSRRWFVLGHNQLCYQSESKAEDLVVVVEDLRICTIKMAEDLDRRFCFEVVTPIRSSLLQADSEAWRRTWMAYLEGGIARALRITASNKKKDDTHELRVRTATLCRDRSPTPELSESPILGKKAGSMASIYSLGLNFLDVPGNERCADCGNLNPKWASINLGVLLCIECCGIHRNLGVHISKVRSITLDEWEQEMQLIMCALGNVRVNGILEYEIPEHVKKPTPNTSRALREDFIRAKYVLNAFVHPHPDFERPEVPVAPQQPSLQQLLSSNKERQADSSPRTTPRSSPHASKRMLSPSLRLRATKPKSYRPLTSAGPSEADLVDSDDDQLREVSGSNTMSRDSAMSNSMALLAENYKKLEKSGKLKNWNIAKLKTPKKRSLTGGLSGKLSKSYQALNRKFRSDSTKSSKSIADRDAHSDNEDCESGTPLLHTNILSPPPKPPRTFKQRKLDLTGDGDDTFVLFDDNDDFSGDILSAIKEMGVVAVSDVEGSRESEREERLSKSLPNGGLKILDGDSLTSPSGHLTPGRPKSPMNISPLASEPPVRAFPPPPPLSPVHEGVGKTLESEARSQEDDDAVVSPPASIASTQTSVFDAGSEKGTLGRFHSVAEVEEEEPTTTNTISTATLVDNTATSVDPSTTEVTYQSTGFVSLSNEDNVDDTFTEFQSAQPEVTVQDDPGTSSMQESTLSQTLKSAHPEVTIEEAPDTQQSMVPHTSMEFQGAQPEATMQEPPSSAGTSGTQELRLLRTNKDIDFDETKRFSMLSVASTDWYSLDEEEADEDNESNCSADFPELTCSIDYRAVCTEEEQHLFSTPPSSPPLAVMIQGRDKRLDSLRDRSNSPRPKSASPVPTTLKRIEEEYREMQQRSRRPKSASPCLTKSVSEDEGTREATLRRQIQSPLANKPEIPDKTEPLEGKEDANSRESSELPSTNSLEENQKTIRSESEGGVEAADESSEMFEDATDAGLEDSSCLSMSAVSATDLSAEKTALPEKKSYSTNTSPTMSEKHKNVSSSSLTRSATDIDLQTKVVKPRFGVRSRQRASTVSGNENVDSISRSSVEEAPTQSKDEEYFVRMIRKTGKDRRPSSECVSFSEQDIVDIFRSSLRGSKVPLVKVERADDGESTVQAEEKDGDKVDGSKESDERGKKRLRVVHSQKEVQVLGGQDVNSDTVETVVIPDNISPDLYLYQSVCTIDLPGILCAKAHGGDINFINFDDEGKSPMLIAIEKCSTHLVEFLYQNGAKLNLTDEKGRGSLHYAALTDDASVVVLLLKRGAKAGAVDNDGKDPVQIAIEQENGDIVTLLRMARLKIEERGNVEDQVAEVYKEFEMAAQTDPERMKRRSKDSSETSSITSRELK